jgi:hypothetical protein
LLSDQNKQKNKGRLSFSADPNYIRRLAREKQLPSYKSNRKCIYFKIEDLDDYLFNNKRISNKKIMKKATKYLFNNK